MNVGFQERLTDEMPAQQFLYCMNHGLAFWEELVNAISMLVANLFVWQSSAYLVDQAVHAEDVMIVRMFSLLHCPCSVSYHVALTMSCRHTGIRDRNTWTRVLDMGFVHVCCIAFSWALTHGSAWFVSACASAN